LPLHAGTQTEDSHALFKPAAAVLSGLMARIVDVPGAFAVHPGARVARARGELGLDVAMPNERTVGYDLAFGAGTGAPRGKPGRKAKHRLAISVSRLGQVYFGGASAVLLVEQGHASGSYEAAALLDEVCAGPPLHLLRLNLF
jgi:hypothetical protein